MSIQLTEIQFNNIVEGNGGYEELALAQYRSTPASKRWLFTIDGVTLCKLYNKDTKTTQYSILEAA